MSFMGIGSFFGALLIATLSRSGPKKFVLFIVPLVVGALLIIDGNMNLYFMMGISLALTGFFFVMFSSSANSSMQLNSSNELRGRVMSVYSMVFAGSTPIGSLFAGSSRSISNARVGFAACGGIIIVLMILIYIFLVKRARKRLLLGM